MVTGIESFKEWFKGNESQYAIIGGTACDILMTEENDVFRLTELIDPTVKIATPSGVYEDMQKFVDRMKNETVDVKQLGLVGRTKEQILQEIGELYAIQ